MNRHILAVVLLASATGCATIAKRNESADGAIPHFNADSLTTSLTGERRYALVGSVFDSASGRALEGAIVSAQLDTVQRPAFAYTNSLGGFVIGRLQPGHYRPLIRKIGYLPFNTQRDGAVGRIDTIRVRLQVSPYILMTTAVRDSASRDELSDSVVSPCLPLGAGGERDVRMYRFTDTTTDGSNVAWRESLSLPRIPFEQITLVRDPAICDRAVTAFNGVFSRAKGFQRVTSVKVIRYGPTRYIVAHPLGPHGGEWRYELVVDSSFNKVAIAGR